MAEGLKDFDANSDVRFIRNFAFSLATVLILLSISSYIACSALIYFIEGSAKYLSLIHQPLADQFDVISQKVQIYWTFWWKFKSRLTLESKHFFVPKLFLSTFVPFIFVGIIVFSFRDFFGKIVKPFSKPEALHGNAHWATPAEIKKAGLFDTDGMLMGEYKPGEYFIAKNYQHVLLFAPTGSGKGVGFVIPNLLFWRESAFVHDIKLENLELTSGYRSRVLKQKVYAWVPADIGGRTHCYNPLDWISKNPGQMVDDVQKIGNILIEKQEFWENEARALIVGVILMAVADPNRQQSFGEVVRILRSDDTAYTLATAMDTFGDTIHPVGYMNIAAFLQKADKERSGVISTGNSRLDLWSNPIVDKSTSRSDFDIQTVKKILTTVYVGLTPDNIQRLKPLMSMFYQQATAFLSRKMPEKDEPHGCMFLMDEFPTLGKMEQFLSGIAYFRGYHVKLFLIVQDTQQLKGTYEDAGMNSFLSNSTYRVTFAANNVETAKLISELIGNKTVSSESMNKPKYFDMNPASRSVHMSKTQRALLLPQEVITLDRNKQIILIEATPPIMCNKIKYWSDPFFKKRLLKSIELPTQKIEVIGRGGKATSGSGGASKDGQMRDETPEVKLLQGHPDSIKKSDEENKAG